VYLNKLPGFFDPGWPFNKGFKKQEESEGSSSIVIRFDTGKNLFCPKNYSFKYRVTDTGCCKKQLLLKDQPAGNEY
jgi:hypothetical protein